MLYAFQKLSCCSKVVVLTLCGHEELCVSLISHAKLATNAKKTPMHRQD